MMKNAKKTKEQNPRPNREMMGSHLKKDLLGRCSPRSGRRSTIFSEAKTMTDPFKRTSVVVSFMTV